MIALSRDIEGADIIVVDETGLGGGVVDGLKDAVKEGKLPKKCEIRGVQFGAACEGDADKEKYVNMKARMFGLLQKDMKDPVGLALLKESVYSEELPMIRYRYNTKGQMVIESKDEFKKRTGKKSPDSADSLALANFGNYDELSAGEFSKAYSTTDSKDRPHAGGLNSSKNW